MGDHQLTIKLGFIVMLLRNLQPANGHVIGARYIVMFMTNIVLFLTSKNERGGRKRLILPRTP